MKINYQKAIMFYIFCQSFTLNENQPRYHVILAKFQVWAKKHVFSRQNDFFHDNGNEFRASGPFKWYVTMLPMQTTPPVFWMM